MEECSRNDYKRLDLSKLTFSDKTLSTEESLKDVIPIDWSVKEKPSDNN